MPALAYRRVRPRLPCRKIALAECAHHEADVARGTSGPLGKAEALRGVALMLVKEGRDPARHEILAAAQAAIAQLR